MDQAKEPSEELVEKERKQADADDESDRQNRRGDPFLASRPRDAPELRDYTADKILSD
jgi:hypothetical protein